MWKEDKINEYIKIHLSEERYIHSLGVMKTSEDLAKHYGVDEYKARIAGLCHDCAKNFSFGDLINKARLSGERIDYVYYKSPQLLHGIVGAYIAKELFRINDKEILDAIKYHTTGREKMSMFEKIVYIADVIEPSRSFKGVNDLRKLAYLDLDRSLLKSFDDTINFVVQRGNVLHANTINARNYLLINSSNEWK